MANIKEFLGIKQVSLSSYNAVADADKKGRLWLVKRDDGYGDIYFGTRHYGHFDQGEIDKLNEVAIATSANTESIDELESFLADLVAYEYDKIDALPEGVTAQTVTTLPEATKETADYIEVTGTGETAGYYEKNVTSISDLVKDLKEQIEDGDQALQDQIDAIKVKNVDGDDKVISLSDDGILSSDVSIDYVKEDKKIYLYGKDTANPISSIDTDDFVKDGMIKDVTIEEIKSETVTEEGVEVTKYYYTDGEGNKVYVDDAKVKSEGNYIHVVWNTDAGDKETFLNIGQIIATLYSEGNDINISEDNEISVALDEDIKVLTGVGYLTNGTTIPKDASLSDILKMIFVKTLYPKSAVKPSISTIATTKDFGVVEIYSTVTVPKVGVNSTSNGKFQSADSSWSQPAVAGVTWSNPGASATVTGFKDADGNTITSLSADENGEIASFQSKLTSAGACKITYTITKDYSAPSNSPKTNTGVETSKSGETAAEGSATWVAGTASKTGATTATVVWPIFTNGVQGNTDGAIAKTEATPTTVSDPVVKLALTSGKAYASYYAPESRTKTHDELYLPSAKKITKAMALNPLDGSYSVDITSAFTKVVGETKGVTMADGTTGNYDIWRLDASVAELSRGAVQILFTIEDNA